MSMSSAREQMCRLVLRHQRRRYGGRLCPIVVKMMMTVLPGQDLPPPALIRMLNWAMTLVPRQVQGVTCNTAKPATSCFPQEGVSLQCADASCSTSNSCVYTAINVQEPQSCKDHVPEIELSNACYSDNLFDGTACLPSTRFLVTFVTRQIILAPN